MRTQVSKVGAWAGEPEPTGETTSSWSIPVYVPNGSELPVWADTVGIDVQPGMFITAASPAPSELVREAAAGAVHIRGGRASTSLGAVAPAETRNKQFIYDLGVDMLRPAAYVRRVVITDAAGYQWETRVDKPGLQGLSGGNARTAKPAPGRRGSDAPPRRQRPVRELHGLVGDGRRAGVE